MEVTVTAFLSLLPVTVPPTVAQPTGAFLSYAFSLPEELDELEELELLDELEELELLDELEELELLEELEELLDSVMTICFSLDSEPPLLVKRTDLIPPLGAV